MNENSHIERLDEFRAEAPEHQAEPVKTLARRWLGRANRLARIRLPGRSIQHFAGALAGRYETADRHRPTVRQVEERLRDAHPEPPAAFSSWLPIPGYGQDGRPEATVRGRALQGAPERPSVRPRASSPSTHPGERQRFSPAIPKPVRFVNRDAGAISTPVAAPEEPLPTGILQSPPLRLDGQVRNRLAGVLEMRIPAVKIYTNQAADQVARQYRADAVTFGDRILFRAGRYEPETPRGLGLIGHELIHAAQPPMPSPAPPAPAATQIAEQEETLALRNEQRILNQLMVAPEVSASGAHGVAAAAQPPPPRAAAGRAAASDRAVGSAGEPGPTAPMIQLSATQLRQIKDDVYRDLLDRLRTEFERGG